MERILFGDNQFFGVNHISDEKSRAQAIKFKKDSTILNTIDYVREIGVETFMCTTHDRMRNVCDLIRADSLRYKHFKIYPCMPYAHKYANAVSELGIINSLNTYLPGSLIGSLFRGGKAYLNKDYISMMQMLIDSEMNTFKGISTPVIFLQNVVTDLLLGLGMNDIFKAFYDYVKVRYNAEAGFITMNMPRLLKMLESLKIYNPVICSSINSIGFRMSGGKELYEHTLKTKNVRIIAMQVFAGGSINPNEALDYVCRLPNIESILFGASSKHNISQTISLIRELDEKYSFKENQIAI